MVDISEDQLRVEMGHVEAIIASLHEQHDDATVVDILREMIRQGWMPPRRN